VIAMEIDARFSTRRSDCCTMLPKSDRPFLVSHKRQDASVDNEMIDKKRQRFALLPSAYTKREKSML